MRWVDMKKALKISMIWNSPANPKLKPIGPIHSSFRDSSQSLKIRIFLSNQRDQHKAETITSSYKL